MARLLQCTAKSTIAEKSFIGIFDPLLVPCCFASKKAGGSTRNQGKKKTYKRRRLIVSEGQLVKPGSILVTQLGFKFHPGQNVSYGRNHCLYALVEGNVKFTKELLDVKPTGFLGRQGPYHDRTFINIVEKDKTRKLVCVNADQFLSDLARVSKDSSASNHL